MSVEMARTKSEPVLRRVINTDSSSGFLLFHTAFVREHCILPGARVVAVNDGPRFVCRRLFVVRFSRRPSTILFLDVCEITLISDSVCRGVDTNNGNASDSIETLSPREKFRVQSFHPMVDLLNSNLEKRALIYNDVSKMFSFFVDLNASMQDIRDGLNSLKEKFPKDLQIDYADEVHNFHSYVKKTHLKKENISHDMLYEIIFKDKVQFAFPNVEAILRLFLSLMVTNCTGKRSFSKLKRIKNYLRTTMSQERLVDSTILYMESDRLRSLSFDDVVEQFSIAKSRRKL